jgi:DNA-directed RNA polymerase specialized sigma24 family protein
MWHAVRRELTRLQWDVEPSLTLDLMSDWTRTVPSLMAVRRTLGPVPAHDPLALLATATTGAARTPNLGPTQGPSLHGVQAALAGVAREIEARPDLDRQREVATLNQVAYELAHWVRVRTPDDRAKAWLLAGETALDIAVHTPGGRSAVGVGLAAWQDALAAVQPVQGAAIVRRSVALGHLAILRDTHALVGEARETGALPQPYADALLGNLRDLARAHQTALSQIDGRQLGSSRVDQAVMLRLGVAVRHVTDRPDAAEPSRVRLDALLRSSIGEAVLVANVTEEPSARPVADALSRLALEYLANPDMLRPADPPGSLQIDARGDRRSASVRELRAEAPASPGEPSIRLGTVLGGDTVLALCGARDLGIAAANGDPTNPPQILRGIDPARWPQLVVEGRQAVTDLVASVIPMVYAQTRGLPDAADLRGQMFVELMGAAHRFDAQRPGPARWSTYAWTTLEHSRWRGVDDAGVVRTRSHHRSPRPTNVSLDGREPVSRESDPGDIIEERQAVEAITQALGRLPAALRNPLLEAMQDHPARVIAEHLGFSESTALRRVHEARDHVRDELAARVDDGVGVPYETVTDPVLERSQRLFEQTFAPSLGPERGRPRS